MVFVLLVLITGLNSNFNSNTSITCPQDKWRNKVLAGLC